MATEKPATLAFLLPQTFVDRSRLHGMANTSTSLTVRLVLIAGDDKPRNLSDGTCYDDHAWLKYDAALADMGLYIWINDRYDGRDGADINLQWCDAGTVSFNRAEKMAKLSRKLIAKLEKTAATFGPAEGVKAAFLRYCDALGVKHVIRQDGTDRGSFYTENSYTTSSAIDGAAMLVRLCEQAHATLDKPEVAMAA